MNRRIVLPSMEIEYDIGQLMEEGSISAETPAYYELYFALQCIDRYVRPRAVLGQCTVEKDEEDGIILDGWRIRSRLLSEKLSGQLSVVLGIVTAGEEIDYIPSVKTKEIAMLLKRATLKGARAFVEEYLKSEFGYRYVAQLNPGSLTDWPRSENRRLFYSLGSVFEDIGVELGEDCFMQPSYTISAVFFDEENYENCALCAKENCPNRRKSFDRNEYCRIFGTADK